jgi:pantothenate kinase
VVVVSSGSSATAQFAVQSLKSAAHDLCAQVIVVSQDHNPSVAAGFERNGAEFVAAPRGCTRAEMCDLGMSRADGAIIAVRDDVSVGDAAWLDVFRKVLPRREEAPVAPFESVVMDSFIASRAVLADSSVAHEGLDSARGDSAIGIAAAV